MLQAALDDVDWDMFRASSADVSEFTDVALSFIKSQYTVLHILFVLHFLFYCTCYSLFLFFFFFYLYLYICSCVVLILFNSFFFALSTERT